MYNPPKKNENIGTGNLGFQYFIIGILLILCQNLYAQNLQTEMFMNQNRIDRHFKTNRNIESLFTKNKKEAILLIAKIENDSTFSIYVKNNQQNQIKFIPQDNSLYLIQEALTKEKEWRPIEFWANSTCGNSYGNTITLTPQQILKTTSYKYSGEFQTKIRFKLLLNNQIYYSNTTEAKIDPEKFKKSTWYHQIKEIYKKDDEAEKKIFLDFNPT